MKRLLLSAIILSLTIASCKGKDEKKKETPATKTTSMVNTGENKILDLDVSTLKDEAAFLQAWEDYTNGRMADEKKKEEDKNYEGHYLEYVKMYTALLKATTAFSKTIEPAASAVAFNDKVSDIEARMSPPAK